MIHNITNATDEDLLLLYSSTKDSRAFGELVRRHAGLVYGTCRRVLGNDDDAQDVSQECFLEFARKAGSVRSSLPAYLHNLARSRSIDAIRKASTRRRTEEEAAMLINANQPTWGDVAPLVDDVLTHLPDRLRVPVIMHYLEGYTQAEIAKYTGMDRSTVSRDLDKGVSSLRESLEKAGVVITVAALAGLLTGNAVTAAPTVLVASLMKTGTAAPAGVGAPTAPFMTTLTGKIVLVTLSLLATAALVVGILTHGGFLSGDSSNAANASYTLAQDQTLVRRLLDSVYAGSLTPMASDLDEPFLRGNIDRATRATSALLIKQFGTIQDLKLQSVEDASPLDASVAVWTVKASKGIYEAKVAVNGNGKIVGLSMRSSSSGEWVPSHMVGLTSLSQPGWVL